MAIDHVEYTRTSASRYQLFVLCLWPGAVLQVHAVDVLCEGNIAGNYDPFSPVCYVNQLITLGDGDRLEFRNVLNTSRITAVKFLTPNRMRSNIHYIAPEIFETFPYLEVLNLAAKVRTLDRLDLLNAPPLKDLIVSDELHVLSRQTFVDTPTLINLELSPNRLVAIEDGAFDGLVNLEFLNLADNELPAIGHHTFAGLNRLRFLKLRHNSIALIDDGALALPWLEMLDLSHNQLTFLSDNVFAGIPMVSSLSLDHNQLSHIGYAIYDLPALNDLDLSDNCIVDINLYEFSLMPALMSLWLRASGLNLEPTLVKNRSSASSPLKSLDVADNGLTDGRRLAQLSVFENLQNLALEGNNFTCIRFEDGANLRQLLPKLERLQLSQNRWECGCLESMARQLLWDDIRVVPTHTQFSRPNARSVDDIECF